MKVSHSGSHDGPRDDSRDKQFLPGQPAQLSRQSHPERARPMTSTFVPSHWPQAPRPAPVFGQRFMAEGTEAELGGGSGTGFGTVWLFKRNCSITPQQLAAAYASLCGVSCLIAGFFFWQGAPFVAAFAGLELLAVGVAMLLFARHAGDCETLTLLGRTLSVERCIGSRVERTELAADWLTVEPAAGQGSLVQLCGRGARVRVGRFLRPELRGAFAQELRQTLRQTLRQPNAQPLRQAPVGHGLENDPN